MQPNTESAFAALKDHRKATQSVTLRSLFEADAGRFERYTARLGDLLLDYSKCAVTDETVRLLEDLARAGQVGRKRDLMFSGARINSTENRAVLHVALRDTSGRPLVADGQDVTTAVNEELRRLRAFAEGIRNGSLRTSRGAPFADIVNIGIGGSDLGPAMATAALAPYHDGPRVHFVSNVDSAHLADTIARLAPERTLVIVASKTFATVETMTNAASARAWIADALGESAVVAHFAAVSTALDRVKTFGIAPERTFGFWDWVGGRYSLWSAIGLPLMIAVGPANFDALRAGAHEMDAHFRAEPFARNLPMLLGALWVWHRAVCSYPARAVIPYDQRLARLPAYLQQLAMESNGKRVTVDGKPVAHPTGALVWGEPGTNAQHAFFQQLHQGTDVVPCEFLIAAESHEPRLARHQAMLIANCLAQSEALMQGRTEAEAKARLAAQGKSPAEAQRLAPHQTFPGNRPSVTLAYRRLDPATLGRLLALYEHAVFVEAAIHGINAFDQWGVELGKELAAGLLPALGNEAAPEPRNSSTHGLMWHLRTVAGS